MAKSQTKAAGPAQTESATEQTAPAYPMKYDVKINSFRAEGSLRANASVNINDAFAIRGVKVMEGSSGLFVSMPSYKAGNGEYKDICFPCTKESRLEFDKAVLGEYQHQLSQLQSQRQEAAPFPEQAQGMSAPTM